MNNEESSHQNVSLLDVLFYFSQYMVKVALSNNEYFKP